MSRKLDMSGWAAVGRMHLAIATLPETTLMPQEFPSPPGAQPSTQPAPVPFEQHEREMVEVLKERDAANDYIDALLTEVLGADRHEWTSAYGHADAMDDVSQAMASLRAQALDTDLIGRLRRIHTALGKMQRKYGEVGSRDIDVTEWNTNLFTTMRAVGRVLCDLPSNVVEKAAAVPAPEGARLAYQQANPLGGPAKIFHAMADAIEAGDNNDDTLRSFGYAEIKPSPAERDALATAAVALLQAVQRDWPNAAPHRAAVLVAADRVAQALASNVQPKGMQPCQGMNCGATDGKSHSPECFAEHAATVDPGVGERHREARYAGYKGEPFPRADSEDEQAAWVVGFKARLPATPSPAPAHPQLWRDGGPKALDPNKCQLCRVGVHSADALARDQNCDCQPGTCRMWNGGLRPAQAPAVKAEPDAPTYLSDHWLYRYAQEAALALQSHSYAPKTAEAAKSWIPHWWVCEAIQSAWLDGQLGKPKARCPQLGDAPEFKPPVQGSQP